MNRYLNKGDFVEVGVLKAKERGKSEYRTFHGIITQVTSTMYIIAPENPIYNGQKESVSFMDIHTGIAKIRRITESNDIY